MKKTIIAANWKMNPVSLRDAEKLYKNILQNLSQLKKTEIVVCPPFLYIPSLKKLSKKILIGAQDSFGLDTGPFTGEIAARMLENIGARYVILGHSERRSLGETNDQINKKLKGVLSAGLIPILCVGETSRDENHEYFNVVKAQLEACLEGISKNSLSKMLIAYEPVWAISSTVGRKDATARDSEEMVIFIKKTLVDIFGIKIELPRILYGGSVNTKDAGEFLLHGGVEGLLVGRASLDAKKFTKIIDICETLNK